MAKKINMNRLLFVNKCRLSLECIQLQDSKRAKKKIKATKYYVQEWE